MSKIITNPFFIYFISFSIVLTFYNLNWCYYYPELSSGLYFFILSTMAVSGFLGVGYHILFLDNKIISVNKQHTESLKKIMSSSIVVFLLYSLEFLYAKDIPLISMILGTSQPGDYLEFGIPTVHVVIVSLSHLLLSVHLDKMYKENNKKHLIYVFTVLICDSLTLSRGLFVFSLMIWGFIKLYYIKKIKITHIVFFCCFFVSFSYLFGLVGQYRSAHGDPVYVEKILGASDEFKKSDIPTPFLWIYIYTTSPLANLQESINENHEYLYSFKTFFVRCLTHQVVSKRFINLEEEKFPLIAQNLTVGTIYYYSYNYFGYFGLAITFIYIISVLFFFSAIARGTKYFIPVISMLNALVFLSIFDNMFITGFSLSLFFAIFILLSKRFLVFFKQSLQQC